MWKNTIKNCSIILSGSIISRFFFFIYTVFAIRELSVQQYGVFAFLISLHTWLLVFAHFNFPAAISKYTSEDLERGGQDDIEKYYSTGFILTIFFSAFATLAGVAFAYRLGINAVTLLVFFSSLIAISVHLLNDGLVKAYGYFKLSAALDIVNGFSRFALLPLFLLVFSYISFDALLVLYCAATIIPLGVSLFYVWRLKGGQSGKPRFEWGTMQKVFSYSKWICFTDLASSGALLIINSVLTLYSYEDVAILNVAFLIFQIFNIALPSLTNVLIPTVSRSVAAGMPILMLDRRKLIYLVIFSAIVSISLIFIPFKAAILTSIFHKAVYSESMTLAAILMLAFPFKVFSTVAKGIIQGMNNPKQGALISLGSLVFLAVIVLPLYLMIGLYGVAFAICSAYVLEYVCYLVSVKKEILGLDNVAAT
jgi:O-antigen/teichoic acid export membrane protein